MSNKTPEQIDEIISWLEQAARDIYAVELEYHPDTDPSIEDMGEWQAAQVIRQLRETILDLQDVVSTYEGERQKAILRAEKAERERDEWKARAEKAEAERETFREALNEWVNEQTPNEVARASAEALARAEAAEKRNAELVDKLNLYEGDG